MRKHRWIIAPAFVALVAVAPAAAADDSPPAAPQNQDGYAYKFRDDPLQAAGLEPLGARILVSRGAARETLIRPRTAFVIELLKSVEHL
jgi:hypothetical protein